MSRSRVAGRCPACGSEGTLFVADGDYITCSLDKCPDPCRVADMLTTGQVDRLPIFSKAYADEIERRFSVGGPETALRVVRQVVLDYLEAEIPQMSADITARLERSRDYVRQQIR